MRPHALGKQPVDVRVSSGIAIPEAGPDRTARTGAARLVHPDDLPTEADISRGSTQFRLFGDGVNSHAAVVFPKKTPTGSQVKCSMLTSCVFISGPSFYLV